MIINGGCFIPLRLSNQTLIRTIAKSDMKNVMTMVMIMTMIVLNFAPASKANNFHCELDCATKTCNNGFFSVMTLFMYGKCVDDCSKDCPA